MWWAVTLPGPVKVNIMMSSKPTFYTTVNIMMSSNSTGTCDSEQYDEQ